MKKPYILIALAIVATLTMVSCKCSSKKSPEPTQEEVQEMKQALADSVLTMIDELYEKYYDASSKSFRIQMLELTDEEKMIKPDYLLDPSIVNSLVTKSQKINALAILLVECSVRKIYDMPQEATKEAIVKLAADVNFNVDIDFINSDSPQSEKVKTTYEFFKERGELASFWQMEEAMGTEISYLLVMNPDLYFGKITEEQWQGYYKRRCFCCKSISELAQYDEEMASLITFINQDWTITDHSEANRLNATIASAKEYRVAQKDLFIAKRNALLQ